MSSSPCSGYIPLEATLGGKAGIREEVALTKVSFPCFLPPVASASLPCVLLGLTQSQGRHLIRELLPTQEAIRPKPKSRDSFSNHASDGNNWARTRTRSRHPAKRHPSIKSVSGTQPRFPNALALFPLTPAAEEAHYRLIFNTQHHGPPHHFPAAFAPHKHAHAHGCSHKIKRKL